MACKAGMEKKSAQVDLNTEDERGEMGRNRGLTNGFSTFKEMTT